jgi:hypothetical protein
LLIMVRPHILIVQNRVLQQLQIVWSNSHRIWALLNSCTTCTFIHYKLSPLFHLLCWIRTLVHSWWAYVWCYHTVAL